VGGLREHQAGKLSFRHALVGELTLSYEALALLADPGQVIVVYAAEPGSASEERLARLRSWAAPTAARADPDEL
jgi:hypothetical protein